MARNKLARVEAALDRGWERLDAGDADGAARAAHEALAIDRRAADAHALLGAAHLDQGRAEEALDCFDLAVELDPNAVDPLLRAAEVLIDFFDDDEAALERAERAEELAEHPHDRADARLLRAVALLGLSEEDRARAALDGLEVPPDAEVGFLVRLGAALIEVDAVDRAEEALQEALRAAPDLADTHHLLGLVHEKRGDRRAMTRAFLRVLELDAREPRPPWALDARDFERVAEEALAELPERAREVLRDVPVIVEDYPAREIVEDGWDPRLMGFFDGTPWPEKSHVAGDSPHLDRIHLYQRNIERDARSREEVIEEIRTTVLHETGHFFALDDDDLGEMGLG